MDFNQLNSYYFETGPIRPPSEAYSLLIRATRNCPWNRCEFCVTYKGQKFELRPVEEVLQDIGTARKIVDVINELGAKEGYAGRQREVAAYISQVSLNDCIRQIAVWLWAGGKSAFLQDANTVIMRTPDLVKVLSALKSTFPDLDRITSYCRSKTAARKSVEDLKQARDAGLTRIHVGMESGCDDVLKLMDKGMTAEDHVKGGKNIREAGIELSEYYMPGLGGKRFSGEHARDSARVLSEINPDFIRLRTLNVMEAMPLWQKLSLGEFEVESEDEVVKEIGVFIEGLDFTGEMKSDHILNLLPEIEGKFPSAKQSCLDAVNRYLGMPVKDRLNYRLGRRTGLYEKLNDIYDAAKYQRVNEAMKRVGAETEEKVDELIAGLKERFL
jgi:radical SAM superfamily enzyme YgiQ (UPF0313 family)